VPRDAARLYVAVLPLALGTAQTLTAVTGSVLAFGISGGFLVVALNAQAARRRRCSAERILAGRPDHDLADVHPGGLADRVQHGPGDVGRVQLRVGRPARADRAAVGQPGAGSG
jgi:hypothetical protein